MLTTAKLASCPTAEANSVAASAERGSPVCEEKVAGEIAALEKRVLQALIRFHREQPQAVGAEAEQPHLFFHRIAGGQHDDRQLSGVGLGT